MVDGHDDAPDRKPSGEERQIEKLGIATIDGAPITYLVSLAAVIAVLALIPIPISVVLASGRDFPISQSLYPLAGWILGPVAGGLANAIGALIGVFIAPYTTSYAPATIMGAALGGLAAGTMAGGDRRASGRGGRRVWWVPLLVVFIGFLALYDGRAIFVNGVPSLSVLLGSFIDWSALLLYALPTRTLFGRFLHSEDLRQLAIGLFGGTWMIAGLVHLATGAVVYLILNYPNVVWLAIAPLAPIEHTFRCVVGTTIGLGVISGLRATGIVKPVHAAY